MKIAFHPFGDGRLFIFAAYIRRYSGTSKEDNNVKLGGTAEYSRFRPKGKRLIFFWRCIIYENESRKENK
ncbi:MAG TPA: hypothetical protein DHV55_00595 [Clostridiaceae bacterium]|nr:hypothetical protein [Clostridiaceae bacterium]